MTTTLYLVTGDALAVIARRAGHWQAEVRLAGAPTYCVAADPWRPELVYCGTFGQGLWRSADAGLTWQPAGEGLPCDNVLAVAVSAAERVSAGGSQRGVAWAGTEPSRVFRSEDGGRTWTERESLRRLPSASTWSFPPRPWTHHVRWIAPDPHVPERVYVGIELGGVMRSLDGGLTWEDRKPGGQHDAHCLRTHPQAPGRVCEAAGGGYAESRDAGASWQTQVAGLSHTYTWSLAIDAGNPDILVLSAARGPYQAHNPQGAEAHVYRRAGAERWQPVTAGLPRPQGLRVPVLAASPGEPGTFYAATHTGAIYCSADTGLTWQLVPVAWPAGYQPRSEHALALEVVEV